MFQKICKIQNGIALRLKAILLLHWFTSSAMSTEWFKIVSVTKTQVA
jgi:hypothetical protein